MKMVNLRCLYFNQCEVYTNRSMYIFLFQGYLQPEYFAVPYMPPPIFSMSAPMLPAPSPPLFFPSAGIQDYPTGLPALAPCPDPMSQSCTPIIPFTPQCNLQGAPSTDVQWVEVHPQCPVEPPTTPDDGQFAQASVEYNPVYSSHPAEPLPPPASEPLYPNVECIEPEAEQYPRPQIEQYPGLMVDAPVETIVEHHPARVHWCLEPQIEPYPEPHQPVYHDFIMEGPVEAMIEPHHPRRLRRYRAPPTPRLIEIREYEDTGPRRLLSVRRLRPWLRKIRSRNY